MNSNQAESNTGFNFIYNPMTSPNKSNITTVKISSPISYNIISNPPESIITSNIIASPIRNKITSIKVLSPIKLAPISVDSTPVYKEINSYTVGSQKNNRIGPYLYDSSKRYNIISNNITSKSYENIRTKRISSPIKYIIPSNQSESNIGYNIISHEPPQSQIAKKYPHESVNSPKKLNSPIRIDTPLRNNIISYPGKSFPYDSPKYPISIQTPSRINYSIKKGDFYKSYPMDSVASPLRQSREIVISRTFSPLHSSIRSDNKFGKLVYIPKDYRNRKSFKDKNTVYWKKIRNNN